MLLLHGGPGATHEYPEAVDSFLPGASVEYYHYDQLGSGFSDQPDEPSLWDLNRFVDEVEQVRQALGLDRDNFVLYGSRGAGLRRRSGPVIGDASGQLTGAGCFPCVRRTGR